MFVYFTALGSLYRVFFLFALVLAKVFNKSNAFRTKNVDMDFWFKLWKWSVPIRNYADDKFTRSSNSVSTFSASIALSMITNVRGYMNSLSPIYEQVLVCLSQWIIVNQRGLMNCGTLVWISYVNGKCYCEIEKNVYFFVLR